jgi:L-cystine uptake protein TcyP (sodium:dicarboxylate symporter family)
VRTFTAIDACGNSSTASRTVTWTSDVTPPVITPTGTTNTLGCNPTAADITAALGTATATDGCGAVTNLTFSDATATTVNCIVTQVRTFTAIDACGNSSTASRTVTWTSDVTPPVITPTGTTNTLGCNPTAADITAALGTATATDGCGAVTNLTFSDATATTVNCIVTQVRTFTAIDACGNSSTASRTVTWTSDVTPPVITPTGTTNTLGCNPTAADITAALGTATATDGCGAVTNLTFSDATATTVNCTVTQVRTFTAIDACGNSSTASRTVTWTSDVTPQ